MKRQRRPGRAVLVLALPVLLGTGCDELDLLGLDLDGRVYHLDRVDGYDLPVVVESYLGRRGELCRLELIDGSVLFRRHRRYELTWAMRETCSGRRYTDVSYPLYTERGDYDEFAGSVRFHPDRARSFRGSVSRTRLVFDMDAHRYRFRHDRLTRYDGAHPTGR